ncbi:YlmC/YmxH family sporulation protein [Clostridium sp. 'deep sea']|uniref:YlmC/YmxH family sporulation protein n=1 Tax=Clostridium sp. 'deep sea' TaxID=2779445 RepID=UPI0018967722|nr:YlmC/YmxH family sporulation protein [Clostridium sp. 'deep sea']QOR36011.1 YlmC/YmxH family sporulation protein [Clostridium sp. 'deep sea']
MRLSEMKNKEIINLNDGSRIGILGEMDVSFNQKTGKVIALEISKGSTLGLRDPSTYIVPWSAIKTFGVDMILIEMEST